MDLWLQLVIVAVCAGVAAALAYLLSSNRAARDVAGAVLVGARQVVAAYLAEHPPDAPTLNGLIAGVYYHLPPNVQARIALETFEALVRPLLQQAEDALSTPPPGDTRALEPSVPPQC